jgi:nucleoside phosphorylase
MLEELAYYQDRFSNCQSEIVKVNNFTFTVYEYNHKKILLAVTGLGTTFAASVLTLVHAYFYPSYIFLSGTAGGIDPKLKIRDVIVVEKAFEAEI